MCTGEEFLRFFWKIKYQISPHVCFVPVLTIGLECCISVFFLEIINEVVAECIELVVDCICLDNVTSILSLLKIYHTTKNVANVAVLIHEPYFRQN